MAVTPVNYGLLPLFAYIYARCSSLFLVLQWKRFRLKELLMSISAILYTLSWLK